MDCVLITGGVKNKLSLKLLQSLQILSTGSLYWLTSNDTALKNGIGPNTCLGKSITHCNLNR